MQALPPLRCTYIQAFHLYRRSFIAVLPLVLLLILSQFLINYWIPNTDALSWYVLLKSLLEMVTTALFFSLIIRVIYTKLNPNNSNDLQSMMTGLKRAGHVFIAYFIATLPLLLSIAGILFYEAYFVDYVLTPEVIEQKKIIYLSLLGFAFILTLLLYTFSFIAGVYIVIKGQNAALSLKQSWHFIRSCWLDTLLLIIVLGMIAVYLDLLFDTLNLQQSGYLITLLMSSFYPSLMVVRFNQITQ